MGLIAEAYPSTEEETPWDFIGETNVLFARRDRMSHESHRRAANRINGVPTCRKRGRQDKLRPERGSSFMTLAQGRSHLAGEAGHFATSHCCAALAAFPMAQAHRFNLHLLIQRGLNQANLQI
jgi:hypothetical protein